MNLLILTAPPASGKTFWIDTFAEHYDGELVVISPLRALADECKDKWEGRIKVETSEEWLIKRTPAKVAIFDEFHLNFYWGDSFRPLLWECFYELAYHADLVIVLTATLSLPMINAIENFSHFTSKIWCDVGNQTLKNFPAKYLLAPSKFWLASLIEQDQMPAGVKLLFCQYRDEVKQWGKKLEAMGLVVWTCVGGEAKEMRGKMSSGVTPDYIVSTTVLSHGVNLPRLSAVIFLYPVENPDFWIQMVARGGRKGEEYVVFALEKPVGMKFNRVENGLRVLILTLKMRLRSFFSSGEQWFLKESS